MFARLQKLLLATTALVPLGLAPAAANPLGAQVVGGSASVQGQGTATVTVTQQTNSAIINWNTFNIGTGEKTNIVMPSSSSVQLDRVTGGLGPSQIFGSLWSNGRVFLVNPDGILIGSGAKIDTGSFLATTHDIANADFMAGRYNFTIPGNPSASVVNQGTITAQNGGFAALVAPGVRNTGTITARLGTVALASGNGFTLDFYGDKLITLGLNDSIAAQVKDVSTGQSLSSLVSNEGKLKANGGTVQLTAVAARQVVDSVINNTGVIEANSIGTRNGMIVLSAATAATRSAGAPVQTVKVSGTLSAAGKRKGTTGGTIQVTGENIQLASATIDASGRAGGGTVLIGGDVGGGNPNPAVAGLAKAQLQPWPVPTATNVSVDAASTINTSATDSGNGGKVVVWSDGSTAFNGAISARGGAQSGNGGFVETSGHQQLAFAGTVDTGASNGTSGTLLLDPKDVSIASTGTWIVTPASIQSALATGNVIVTTPSGSGNGDITVAQGVNWSSAYSLTLNAYRNIAVNANITNTGGAAVTLRADDTGTGVGTVTFGSGIKVSTSGQVSIFYNPFVNPAGSVVNSTSYVSPTENYSGNVTGGATLTAYMLVNSVYDLQNITNNLSGTYALGKDIDASATVSWNSGAGFIPIAGGSSEFTGTFNGLGHVINGLTINAANATTNSTGLFAVNGGAIENVGLTNLSVIGRITFGYAGGLAGDNAGTISNSYTTGSVGNGSECCFIGGLVGQNDGTISNSYSTASVQGTSGFNAAILGGLVGSNLGSIIESFSTGTVRDSGTGASVMGGLVGENGGIINRSYATGSVIDLGTTSFLEIGGFVGSNFGSGAISQSYSTASVSVTSTPAPLYGSYVGGFIGYLQSGSISQSYAAGSVTCGGGCGFGFVGLGPLPIGGTLSTDYWNTQTTGRTTDGASSGTTGWNTSQLKAALPTNFDSSVWAISGSVNSGYPYLQWQTAGVSPTNPTTLTGASGLIPITVTADSLSKVYGTADPTLTYSITSGSLIALISGFSGALTRAAGENVGIYAITLGTLALPPIYTLTYVGGTLTITPIPTNAGPFTSNYVNNLTQTVYSPMAGSTPPVIFTMYVPLAPSSPSTAIFTSTVAEQYASQFAAPILSTRVDGAGYIHPSLTPSGLQQECAVLVQTLNPVLGLTGSWTPGAIVGPGNSTLSPGTPIATFKNGQYPSDGIMDPNISGLAKFAHAAIFIDYVKNSDNKIIGMYVLDQYEGKPAGISYKALPGKYQYSVID